LCCALAGTDCRSPALRRRVGRPQLKRDPLGGCAPTTTHAGSQFMPDTLTPPYIPQVPRQTPDIRVQPPLVYVQPVWEYKHLVVDVAPDEGELNSLGAEGWELAGVVPASNAIHFYFKRLVR